MNKNLNINELSDSHLEGIVENKILLIMRELEDYMGSELYNKVDRSDIEKFLKSIYSVDKIR